MEAMERSGNAEIGRIVVGGYKESMAVLKNNKKGLVVSGIEKEGRGSRMHEVIRHSSTRVPAAFIKPPIELPANIKTGDWIGYMPLIENKSSINT